MKHLKLMVLLVVTMLTFTFAGANAQGRHDKGRYTHNGRHYQHRKAYMRNHHRYYRYF